MKRVFIHAFLAGNFGDDLMVRILCERYPKVRFYVYADSTYKKAFEDIKNLKYYAPRDPEVQKWDTFWKKVKHVEGGFYKMLVRTCYATVHIGGSVFVQHFDDYSAFYNTDAQLRRMSKRMYVTGANFGPYSDENYYRQYHELLRCYDGIVFRDTYSRDLFQDLPNVRYAPDVVFNYKAKHLNQAKQKKQVLISVIKLEGRDNNFPISGYADVCKNFIKELSSAYIKLGYSVMYVSFCEMQQDHLAIEEIRCMLKEEERKHTDSYSYKGNIEECVKVFSESEIVVGTRFHSIILAELLGKKFIPIVYDKKTLHTLEDHEVRNAVSLEELENTDVNEIIYRAERIEEEKRKKLILDAEGQFLYLDQIFR